MTNHPTYILPRSFWAYVVRNVQLATDEVLCLRQPYTAERMGAVAVTAPHATFSKVHALACFILNAEWTEGSWLRPTAAAVLEELAPEFS